MNAVPSCHGASSKRQGGLAHRSPKSEAGLDRRSPKGEGGFTLIELVAVMTIIAVLSVVVVGGVRVSITKARTAATGALFQRLSLAINSYREDYGAYPPEANPSNPSSGGWGKWCFSDAAGPTTMKNLNMSSEVLWYFLAGMYEEEDIDDNSNGFRGALARKTSYITFTESDLKRTGYRCWMVQAGGTFRNKRDTFLFSDDLPEIVDPWGSPIRYVAKNGTDPEPLMNEETYDLISRGPDRKIEGPYDTDPDEAPNKDNIKNW